MNHIALISKDRDGLASLTEALEARGCRVKRLASAAEFFAAVADEAVDVVVADSELADCHGLTFIKELTIKHPLVNSALVSALPPDEFHEVTEGLGVFMQLPRNPGAAEAEKMIQLLESIHVLLTM